MNLSRKVSLIGAICLIVGLGCGGKPGSTLKLVKVTGAVKFDGKPLTKGTITFVTDDPKGTNASGEIDAQGIYSLSTQNPADGVPPGNYKVRIESWATPPKMDETGVDPGKSAIPDRYNQSNSSGLTAAVKDSPAAQRIDFDLTP